MTTKKELREDLPAEIDSMYDSSDQEGAVRIAENVFSSIIKNYTLEIPEVIKFASGSLVGGLVEMIGKKSHDRPIRVDIMENDQVEVTVNVLIQFGAHVPTIASKVQKLIRRKIEELTGKEVVRVNINIVDLVHGEEEEAEPQS